MILSYLALFISLAGFLFICFCKFDEWMSKRQEFQILATTQEEAEC